MFGHFTTLCMKGLNETVKNWWIYKERILMSTCDESLKINCYPKFQSEMK